MMVILTEFVMELSMAVLKVRSKVDMTVGKMEMR